MHRCIIDITLLHVHQFDVKLDVLMAVNLLFVFLFMKCSVFQNKIYMILTPLFKFGLLYLHSCLVPTFSAIARVVTCILFLTCVWVCVCVYVCVQRGLWFLVRILDMSVFLQFTAVARIQILKFSSSSRLSISIQFFLTFCNSFLIGFYYLFIPTFSAFLGKKKGQEKGKTLYGPSDRKKVFGGKFLFWMDLVLCHSLTFWAEGIIYGRKALGLILYLSFFFCNMFVMVHLLLNTYVLL